MQLREEILNIEYHKVRLMIKSLNLSNSVKSAAIKCGVSPKCFYNYMNNYNIQKRGDVWVSNQLTNNK